MAAVCRSYASHDEAVKAVEAALGAGLSGEGVLVLTGERPRDSGDEPVGQFAGTEPHDARIGSFGDEPHAQDESTGAFAGERAQRGGSFADADHEAATRYPGGVERMHAVSHHRVLRLLKDAGLDEATATSDLAALHAGRVLVLVDVGEADAERIGSVLDG